MISRGGYGREGDRRRLFAPAAPRSERRDRGRVEIAIGVTVRERHWRAQPARLLDLSLTGCRVSEVHIRVGQKIWVTLGDLSGIEAVATWTRTGETGLRFEVPLHVAVFDHIVAKERRRTPWR